MDKTYNIPANYLESGYWLNGRVSKRRLIEAVILGVIGYMICSILPIPHNFEEGITAYIIIIAPLFMIGFVGIQDQPVSIFLRDVYRWSKKRKPYFFNNHGMAYSISAAQLMQEEESMRDIIMDKIAAFRRSLKAPEIHYVEGENFQFADDPEALALQEAEERRQEEMEAAEQEKAPAKANTRPAPKTTRTTLNLDDIVDNIVLHDLDNGDKNHG